MTGIRAARPSDLEPVIALDADLFGADAWSAAVLAAEFAAAGGTRHLVVAESDTGLMGYAILLTVADVADLQRIGVARRAQRLGLGSLLMRAVTAHAVSSECERVLLEVNAHNDSAIAFYRHLGFVEIARRPGYYPSGTDAVVMACALPRRADRDSAS